jgi:hypothetical protein
MVPRIRTVSWAEAGKIAPIEIRPAVASMRCIVPDIVILPVFKSIVSIVGGCSPVQHPSASPVTPASS